MIPSPKEFEDAVKNRPVLAAILLTFYMTRAALHHLNGTPKRGNQIFDRGLRVTYYFCSTKKSWHRTQMRRLLKVVR